MKQYKYSTLANIVKKFKNKRLMVVGDLLLDQYLRGDVSRISPEAPVPVVRVKDEKFIPGGACNVAGNLSELGAKVSLVGIVGADEKADKLKKLLLERNIYIDGIITDKERPTILKTRVIAQHQQVVRIDREDTGPVAKRSLRAMEDYVSDNIENFDGIVIEDYGKGVITPSIQKIVKLARRKRKMIAVDPKESHFSFYKGASVITPNHHEAAMALGYKLDSDDALKKGGQELLKRYNAQVILITLGEKGMMVFETAKKPRKIQTLAQEVFDVSGAGDTVVAVYALSIVSGASPIVAAHVANCAAGIVVGREGTAVIERDELLKKLKLETGRSRG